MHIAQPRPERPRLHAGRRPRRLAALVVDHMMPGDPRCRRRLGALGIARADHVHIAMCAPRARRLLGRFVDLGVNQAPTVLPCRTPALDRPRPHASLAFDSH